MHRKNFNRSHTEMIFEKCRHVFELIRFDHSELAVGYSQRVASGDPRPSIAERYPSKDQYLARVRHEAEKLVEQRYMLEEDIEFSVERAERFWDYLSTEG